MQLTLGEKLKDLRNKKGLTTDQVCSEIEKYYKYTLSTGKYNEMERDIEKDFGYKAFVYLAKFYNVSVDYLLGISDDPCVIDDTTPIIKYTGLSRKALEFVKRNSDAINLLLKTDYPKQIVANLKEIFELSREQRYTDDWWGKYDIPSLIDDGKLKNAENISTVVSRALLKDMHFESNGDAYACIAILQEKKELIEYNTQKIIFKLFEFISNYSDNDNEYFKKRYLDAYNYVHEKLVEEIEFYNDCENMKKERYYIPKYKDDSNNKIYALKEWLSLLETEVLNNANHNPKKE